MDKEFKTGEKALKLVEKEFKTFHFLDARVLLSFFVFMP